METYVTTDSVIVREFKRLRNEIRKKDEIIIKKEIEIKKLKSATVTNQEEDWGLYI